MPEVTVYTSSVAGSVKVKKEISGLLFLLQSAKIPFEEVDVSQDNADAIAKKEHMIATSGKRTLPQLFVDGTFKCGYEEVVEANEFGELRQFLGFE